MVDYESLTMSLVQDGNALSAELSTDLPGAYVQFLTVEGWKALTGQQLQPLGDHQVALCVQEGNLGDQITLLGEDYTVTQRIEEAPKNGSLAAYISNTYYIVVDNDVTLDHLQQSEAASRNYSNDLNWELAVTLSGTDQEKLEVIDAFRQQLKTEALTLNGTSYPLDWYASVRQDNICLLYTSGGKGAKSQMAPGGHRPALPGDGLLSGCHHRERHDRPGCCLLYTSRCV